MRNGLWPRSVRSDLFRAARARRVSCFGVLGEPIDRPCTPRRHSLLASFVGLSKAAQLMRLSSEQHRLPDGATSSRLGFDDLTFHSRGNPEPGRKMAALGDGLGRSAANEGAANARIATVAKRIFFMVSPVVVRPVLDNEQIGRR